MAPRPQNVAVATMHENLLNLLSRTDCSANLLDLYNLSAALRIRPRVDLRRLRRAVAQLQAHHDCLRMGFVKRKGVWQGRIYATPRTEVVEHDATGLDRAGQMALLNRINGTHLDFARDPLFQVHLLHCGGSDGDVLLIRASHVVSDGFGWVVLTEDFLDLLSGMPPRHPRPGFLDYMAAVHTYSPAYLKRARAYWENLLFPVIPPPRIGRTARGLPLRLDPDPQGDALKFQVQVTPALAQAIKVRAPDLGVTPYVLLATGLWTAVRDISGDPGFYLSTLLARSDARLHNYAGFHADHLEIVCHNRNGETFDTQARAISTQMRESISHLPFPDMVANGPLHRRIGEEGGNHRQFGLRITTATGRLQNSAHRAAMTDGNGLARIGPITVEPVPLPRLPTSTRELTMTFAGLEPWDTIAVSYDPQAFDEKEARTVVARLLEAVEKGR